MICTLAELKEELAFSGDLGNEDDPMMTRKLEAAQTHVERLLGYKIEEQFGEAEGQEPVPLSIKEAVLALAAHLYDRRGDDGPAVPEWVADVVQTYRGWTF